MFYFDEDHMENGFDAPEVSDQEEDHKGRNNEEGHLGGGDERGPRSPGNGRPSAGSGWQRPSNSGSTTTSSTGSYCGGRFSPEATSRRSHSGRSARFELGRDSEVFRPIGGDFDELEDWQSESEEQPAELVPLGMRTLNLSACKNRHRHRKARSNFTDFYKLTEEHLGCGAYASVRTGVSISTGKEFAIKLVDKHEPGHTRARIMREVEIFNMCKNHPNIVQLHEWFEDHDYFYMVFEKMRGGPLLNHIQQKGFFTEQEASKVTRDIATALKFLHDRGIAHRDVKPENVLCSDFDHVSPVKLCDLDLASKAAPPSPPKLPSVNSEPDLASPVGSAEFMAPEVVDAFVGDALKYDKRCDMWSLGVIVYIMICGYPPFYGQCWRENCGWDQGLSCNDCQENLFKRIQRGEFDFPDPEWENVSEGVKDLICHLLVKNVRERFTADDVLKHPWIRNGAPDTKLQTPGNLFRNDSARDMHQMQEHFNVMSRIVAARLSSRLDGLPIETSSDEEVCAVEQHKKDSTSSGIDMSADAELDEDANCENTLEKATVPMVVDDGDTGGGAIEMMPSVPKLDLLVEKLEKVEKTSAMKDGPTVVTAAPPPPVPPPPKTSPAALKTTQKENDTKLVTVAPVVSTPNILTNSTAGNSGNTSPRVSTPVPQVVPMSQASQATMFHNGAMNQQHLVLPASLASMMQHSAPLPSQVPLHVSQMAMGNPYVYGGGLPNGVPLQAVPFHANQLINMNGVILYPHALVAPQVFPQQFTPQQQMMQYKFGLMPQQFMAPPPPGAGNGGCGGASANGTILYAQQQHQQQQQQQLLHQQQQMHQHLQHMQQQQQQQQHGYYTPVSLGGTGVEQASSTMNPGGLQTATFFVKRATGGVPLCGGNVAGMGLGAGVGVGPAGAMLTVQATGVPAQVVTDQLETCQTAMARQDSKGDLPPQSRETQVNV